MRRASNSLWATVACVLAVAIVVESCFFAAYASREASRVSALERDLEDITAVTNAATKTLSKTEKELGVCRENLDSCKMDSVSYVSSQPKRSSAPPPIQRKKEATVPDTGSTPAAKKLRPNHIVVGIPTMSRKQNPDYLMRVLESYKQQLSASPSDALWGRIKIVVMNNELNRPHTVYERAKEKFSKTATGRAHFSFHEKSNPPLSHQLPARGAKRKPGGAPSSKQRKQTLDVVHLTRFIANVYEPQAYMFTEDDFTLCAGGLEALQYLMRKATAYAGDWLSIRFSFGLNGLLLPGKDMNAIADYLERHQHYRPPDHLTVEWFAGETKESAAYKGARQHLAFKYNILDHIGAISTLRTHKAPDYPKCWQILGMPTNFQVESFDESSCPHDDVSPCKSANEMEPLFPHPNAA